MTVITSINETRNFLSTKIYGSLDGMKVIDFSGFDYLVDKTDSYGNIVYAKDHNNQFIPMLKGDGTPYLDQNGNPKYHTERVFKGHRLKIEATLDGWKTKNTLLLQDQELVDLILVLSGKLNECKATRENKSATTQYQGLNSYITVSAVNGFFAGFKIQRYHALQIRAIILDVLKKTFKTELHIDLSHETILDLILANTTPISTTNTPTSNNNQATQTTVKSTTNNSIGGYNNNNNNNNNNNPKPQTQNYSGGGNNNSNNNSTTGTSEKKEYKLIEMPEGDVHCVQCNYKFDKEKGAKIYSFSMSKYGKPLCYNCQPKK